MCQDLANPRGYCILTRRARRRGDAVLPGDAGTEARC